MQELQQCLRLIKLYFSRDEFDCLGDAICEVTQLGYHIEVFRSDIKVRRYPMRCLFEEL